MRYMYVAVGSVTDTHTITLCGIMSHDSHMTGYNSLVIKECRQSPVKKFCAFHVLSRARGRRLSTLERLTDAEENLCRLWNVHFGHLEVERLRPAHGDV